MFEKDVEQLPCSLVMDIKVSATLKLFFLFLVLHTKDEVEDDNGLYEAA